MSSEKESGMKAPTNTTREADIDHFGTMALAISPGGIEHQEARGQAELVASDTLPTEIRDAWVGEARVPAKAILEGFGVEFLGPVEGDAFFQV